MEQLAIFLPATPRASAIHLVLVGGARRRPDALIIRVRDSSDAQRMALAAAAAALDKKAMGVEIIDVAGKVDYADYLVLMTGHADRHVAAIADGVFEELAGLFESLVGLAEVDDRHALAVIENERLGARIPALGLVTEVNACVEQVLGRDADGHVDRCI